MRYEWYNARILPERTAQEELIDGEKEALLLCGNGLVTRRVFRGCTAGRSVCTILMIPVRILETAAAVLQEAEPWLWSIAFREGWGVGERSYWFGWR